MNNKYKYVDSIDTSHDVVAYLMITMNYISAKKLVEHGANVHGLVRTNSYKSHLFYENTNKKIALIDGEICDKNLLSRIISEEQINVIFHLAAQALVRPSYKMSLETISTNAMGTANVLEAARSLKNPVVMVMITSDKAYDNVEWVWGYRETDRLGGKDPYSASKGMAELTIRSYVESFFNNFYSY